MWADLCCLPRVTTSVAVSTEAVQQIQLVVEVGDIVDIAEECFDLSHNAVGMERVYARREKTGVERRVLRKRCQEP
jgi:hypothetical protein